MAGPGHRGGGSPESGSRHVAQGSQCIEVLERTDELARSADDEHAAAAPTGHASQGGGERHVLLDGDRERPVVGANGPVALEDSHQTQVGVHDADGGTAKKLRMGLRQSAQANGRSVASQDGPHRACRTSRRLSLEGATDGGTTIGIGPCFEALARGAARAAFDHDGGVVLGAEDLEVAANAAVGLEHRACRYG